MAEHLFCLMRRKLINEKYFFQINSFSHKVLMSCRSSQVINVLAATEEGLRLANHIFFDFAGTFLHSSNRSFTGMKGILH
jgi:hypothetical protein